MTCLIAKPGTNLPNCHEKEFCQCDLDREKNSYKQDIKSLTYWFNKYKNLEEKVSNLFIEIEHGDEAHKKWLKEKLEEYFEIKQKEKRNEHK